MSRKQGAYKGRTNALTPERAAELVQRAGNVVPKAVLVRDYGISRETATRPTPPSWNEAPALPKAVAPNVDGMAGRKIYHRRFRSYGSGLLRCFGRKCELHIAPSRPNMVGDTELMERRAYRFVSPHRPASSLKGKPEGFVRKAYFCPLRTNSNPRSALVRRLSHD